MNLSIKKTSIKQASLIIGLGTIFSRGLGILRTYILNSQYPPARLGIYYAAFRIPDFIYAIFIFGTLSAAFIPLFSSLLSPEESNSLKKNSDATLFASEFLTNLTISLGVLAFLLFIFAYIAIEIIAPGLTPPDKQEVVLLTRLMLLQPILLAMGTVFSAVLQTFRRFLVAAIAPSLYNLGIIVGALFLVKPFGLNGLAFGVLLGALALVLVQLPSLFAVRFSWRIKESLKEKFFKKTFKLMGPRMLAVVSDQINVVAITAIASTISLASITIFNQTQDIAIAPIGIIGVTLATAVFPSLSLSYSQNQKESFVKTMFRAFKTIIFFAVPISILFILLRAQIVRVLLGTKLFDWESTRLAAACLGLFGISFFAQALIPLLNRGFFAIHNSKTPMIIGFFATIMDVALSLSFLHFLSSSAWFHSFLASHLKLQGIAHIQVVALPLSFSITAIAEFLLLFFMFLAQFPKDTFPDIALPWLKTVFASSAMALVTYESLRPLANFFDMTTRLGVFLQGLSAGLLGFAIYFAVTFLLNENPFIHKKSYERKT